MLGDQHVQYGCGYCAPTGWRNFDASPTLRFERLPLLGRLYTKNAVRFPANVEWGDIVKGLPIAPESCAAIYCSHVLEHLSLTDFRTALRNTNLLLHPGGTFRLVVPDLEYAARRYLADPANDAAHTFMIGTCLGQEVRARSLLSFFRQWLGNTRHLWMWDYKSLSVELESAGFSEIRRASFGDSEDPCFTAVEDYSRWETCLGVECRKPRPPPADFPGEHAHNS